MNYYEHHLGDWAAATGHLSWDEDMAYTRLIRAYYHQERAIPQGQQYRLAKAATSAQRKAVDTVLAEFFELRDGCYHQKRADAEIERFRDKQAKARRSAEARWNPRPSHTERNANASSEPDADAMRTHSEGNAHQTPDTRHQKEQKQEQRRRGARLPPDWQPTPEQAEWARGERPDLDVRMEAEKFRDYWHAKAGNSATKVDWAATWRMWIRNAHAPIGRLGPSADRAHDALREAMRGAL